MTSVRLKWHTQTLVTLRGKFQKILRKTHPSECHSYPGRKDGRGNGGYSASQQILTNENMEKSHSQVILPCTEEATKFVVV